MMHSNHQMKISCDDYDYDVREITTNYPRIGAELGRTNSSVNQDLFKELPEREDDWTSGEKDLKTADTSLPDGQESLMLGGASLATGVAAGIPTLGIGTAAFLTGTSVVFGLSGMIASMDDQGEEETQTDDEWSYRAKETTGGIISFRKDISVFSHNLIMDIPVKHDESRSIDIVDKINTNGNVLAIPYHDDERPWMQNHEQRDWALEIPAYSSDENARNNPPTVADAPTNSV